MACKRCEFKGYVESVEMRNASEFASIKQCIHCKDIAAYSRAIQARFAKNFDKKELPEKSEPPEPNPPKIRPRLTIVRE